jgi:hypothetical protein
MFQRLSLTNPYAPLPLAQQQQQKQAFGHWQPVVDDAGRTTPAVTFTQPDLFNASKVTVKLTEAAHPDTSTSIELQRKQAPNGVSYWQSEKPVPVTANMAYQTVFTPTDPEAKPVTYLDVTQRTNNGQGNWNLIDAGFAKAPHKLGAVLDVFADSMVDSQTALKLSQESDPYWQARNHVNSFRQYGVERGELGHGAKGLIELLDLTKDYNFKVLLLKPFTGGDTSSHGYWTTDFYALNPTFNYNMAEYKALQKGTLQRDLKLYCDLATNVGMASVPMMSNLLYGYQSPFMDFIGYGRDKHPARFPSALTNDKFNLGMLPVRLNPNTLQPETRWEQVGFRIVNPPDEQGRYTREPYLETYQASLYTPDGKLKPYDQRPDKTDPLRAADDTIYQRRFRVDPEALRVKLKQLKEMGVTPTRVDAHTVALAPEVVGNNADKYQDVGELLNEWPHFRLTIPADDNSGNKWHGSVNAVQVDVANSANARQHLKDSMRYWYNTTQANYLSLVGGALTQAKAQHPEATPAQLIEAVTADTVDQPFDATTGKLLGPVSSNLHAFENAQAIAKRATLKAEANPKVWEPQRQGKVGQSMAAKLHNLVPLDATPLHEDGNPLGFKITLQQPHSNDRLAKPRHPLAYLAMLAHNLTNSVFGLLHDTAPHRSVQGLMGDQLAKATKQLPEAMQQSLAVPAVQATVVQSIGPDLYQWLLTGTTSKQSNHAMVEGYYHTVPEALRFADPLTAGRMLPGFLKQRLYDPKAVEVMQTLLADALTVPAADGKGKPTLLTPEALQLANAVLLNREYGLNFRLDAAKELGDIPAVDDTPKGHRKAIADQQIGGVALDVWQDILSAVPQANVLAEWTNDHPNAADGMPYLNDLLGKVDSFLDYRWFYDRVASLTGRLRRNNLFDGESDFTPARVQSDVYMINETLPRHAVQGKVNIMSVHDNESLTDNVSKNAGLSEADYSPQLGLKDNLTDGVTELLTKPALAHQQALIKAQPFGQHLLEALTQAQRGLNVSVRDGDDKQHAFERQVADWCEATPGLTPAQKATVQAKATQTPDVRNKDEAFWLADAATNPNNGLFGNLGLSPKAQQVGESLFKGWMQQTILPRQLGYATPALDDVLADPATWQAVDDSLAQKAIKGSEADVVKSWLVAKAVVVADAVEASDVKAARARLNNLLEADTFPWDEVLPAHQATQETQQAVKQALYQGFQHVAALDGKAVGYYGFEHLLQRLVTNADAPYANALPADKRDELASPEVTSKLVKALFAQLQAGVLPKVEPAFLLTGAMQGQPSFHLTQDLFATTGSERTTNDHQGNRQAARTHHLVPSLREQSPFMSPQAAKRFDQFQAVVKEALSLKDRFPAINDGTLLRAYQFNGHNSSAGPNEAALNDSGVMLLPYSNGQQTVLVLNNTKQTPTDRTTTSWWTTDGRIGQGARYPEIEQSQPTVSHYTADLSALGLPEGSQFVAYHDNDPNKTVAHTYTLHNGKLEGVNFADQLVLELAKTPQVAQ